MDNVDDEKGTPAEQEDSHNDAHLINRLMMIPQLHMMTMIMNNVILTVMVALCSSIRL